MAQKQYEMLFELNAKLGAQYSATFKSAQGELAQFRAAYRELAQTTNDVSGYQRQQQAAENTKAKLELLQRQYDNIQKEIEQTGGYSSELENKLLSKQAQIDKTTQAYERQQEKLAEYRQRLEEAGVDTSKLDEESKRLTSELEKLKQGFSDSGEQAEQFGERGKEAALSVGDALAAAGIAAALKAIYDAAGECVDAYAEFEASMSGVEAIAGANAEELAALTAEARELGETTVFTARQVSEGMTYMAMAGWETNAMLEGMDDVLALAAASGEDLGSVSDIVTDSLTAFGLTAKDTARFADVLAQAAANANTNVGLMGQTFKYAAPVAGALGYSIEDVAVMSGLMANAGIKASLSGTTMRNTFNGLLGEVTLTGKAFGEMKITTVNTDGSMKALRTTVDELRAGFSLMTEAERVQNAVNIAGQRGYAGLLAVLNATEEDYNKLTESINNSTGAAQRMAAIKLDNLQGEATLAQSAMEGLRIEIGEVFAPTLEELHRTQAAVANDLTAFVREHPGAVKALTALTVGVGGFVAITTAQVAITKLAAVAQTALNAAMDANPVLLVVSAVGALVAGLTALAALGEPVTDVSDHLTASAQQQQEQLAALNEEYARVSAELGETSYEAQELQWRIEELDAELSGNTQTLGDWSEELQNSREAHEAWVGAWQETSESLDAEGGKLEALIGKLAELSAQSEQTAGSTAQMNAIVGRLNDMLPELELSFDPAGGLSMTAEKLREIARASIDAKQAAADYDAYLSAVEEHDRFDQWARKAEYERAMAQYRYDAAKRLYDAADPNFIPADVARGLDDARRELERWNYLADGANELLDDSSSKLDELEGRITGYAEAQQDAADATETVETVLGSYRERIDALTQAYTESYEAAKESISGQYQLWDDVAEVSAKSVDEVIGSLDKQAEYWRDYKENIQTLLGYSGEIEGLSEMVAEFGDGSADSVNMIAGMAEASKAGDPAKLQALVDAWRENKKAQDEAAQSLGDLSTGYSTEMGKLQGEISDAVRDMDKSSESYAAAWRTVDAFIAGANALLPQVRTAYREIGQTALNALYPSRGRGAVMEGYASGTDNATPGWHLVGEHGPELEYFFGGEHVVDAAKTQRILRAADNDPGAYGGEGVQISFAPVYNLSGVGDAAQLRETLAAHDEELKRQIVELLDERAEDRVRRAYL